MYIEVDGQKTNRPREGLKVYHYLYSKMGQKENLKINYLAEEAYGTLRCSILLGHKSGYTEEINLVGEKEWGRYGPVGDLVQTVKLDMSSVIVAIITFKSFGLVLLNYMKFKADFEKELNLYNNTTENSLMNMCRKVVRQRLGKKDKIDTLHDFDSLPLPPSLKIYLHCYRGRWCNKGCNYCRFSWSKTIDRRKL